MGMVPCGGENDCVDAEGVFIQLLEDRERERGSLSAARQCD